jgi:hypothetical protein
MLIAILGQAFEGVQAAKTDSCLVVAELFDRLAV